MSRSLVDVDRDALSPEAARVFDEIAWKIAVEDLSPAQAADRLGMTTAQISDALEYLGCEIEAQLGGAKLPDLEEAEYQVLRDDIAERGQLVPILVTSTGKVVDGKNRIRACRELGIDAIERVVDLADEEVHGTTLALQLARRQLTTKQKQRIIRVELIRDGERSDREIARALGVSHSTVGSVRAALEQLRAAIANPRSAGDAAAPAPAPRRKTVSVDAELYDALVELAHKAAGYYGRHETEHRDPELEQAFGRWQQARDASGNDDGGSDA